MPTVFSWLKIPAIQGMYDTIEEMGMNIYLSQK
jgi:hypothetical protein